MKKVIFFGTPSYVIPILEALYKTYKLVGVVTQSPKEVGREKIRTFSAVDAWAHKHKIPVTYVLTERLPEANLGIVASYGKIIPQNVIDHFPNGILNVHPSLLPKYRGASPIQSQIIDGVKETGVSVIKMDKLMDHGPIISQFKDEIQTQDTNETLKKRLFERSAQFLIDLLPNYLSNKINLKPQDENEATFTKIISREDGLVDLKKDNAIQIERKFRALEPWPGLYVVIDGNRIKLLGLHLEESRLILDKVQLASKKPVTFEEFKRGYPHLNFTKT